MTLGQSKQPQTPVELSNAEYYRSIVRYVDLHDVFDAVIISRTFKIPYGSVTRVLSTMCASGYTEAITQKAEYRRSDLLRNIETRALRINYSANKRQAGFTAKMWRKTPAWNSFMSMWNMYVKTEDEGG